MPERPPIPTYAQAVISDLGRRVTLLEGALADTVKVIEETVNYLDEGDGFITTDLQAAADRLRALLTG